MEETESWIKMGFWIRPPSKILKSTFDEKKTLVFHDHPVNEGKNIHAIVFLKNVGIDKRFPTLIVELLPFSKEKICEVILKLKQLTNMMNKRYLRVVGTNLPELELKSAGCHVAARHEKYFRTADGTYLELTISYVDLATEHPSLKRQYHPLTDDNVFYPTSEQLEKPRDFSVDTDLQFRWIRPSDATFLARFDAQWNVVRSIGTGVHLHQRSEDFWKRFLSDPVQLLRFGVFLVAVNKKTDEVIGSCTIYQDLTRPAKFHVGEMAITVAAKYQGLGVGTKLLKEALTTSMKKGMRLITFSSFEFNIPGTKLYEKLGCKVVGKLPGWFVEREATELIWEKWLG